jgi:hypothetical protein
MAHFAQLDENGVVLSVIVVNNDDIGDLPFPESEPIGIAFCQSLFGIDTIWKQTSYNASFRGVYAGIGGIYDPARDIFVHYPNYAGAIYDHATGEWIDPAVEVVRSIVEANNSSLPTDEEIMARMSAMRGA